MQLTIHKVTTDEDLKTVRVQVSCPLLQGMDMDQGDIDCINNRTFTTAKFHHQLTYAWFSMAVRLMDRLPKAKFELC